MPTHLVWNLSYPINKEEVLPEGTLIVKSQGTSTSGQFEITGRSALLDGTVISNRDMIGKSFSFVLPSPKGDSHISMTDEYPVKGTGEKVRVHIGSDKQRLNIGNLFAGLFMLPDVSLRELSIQNDTGVLKEKTYWLDDIACKINSVRDGLILLEPVMFVIATGNKNDESIPKRMAMFDYVSRLNDLYAVCSDCADTSTGWVKTALSYQRDVLEGVCPFSSKVAMPFRQYFANDLERAIPGYRSEVDPLPYLADSVSSFSVGCNQRKVDKLPHNWVFTGAPGTGKSYQLDKLAKENFDKKNIRRVTFYPDYTYSQFVGGYKPFPRFDKDGKLAKDAEGNPTGEITYDFIPGPFMRTYVDAVRNPEIPYLLIIEEINRANPAAVFGDLFQLLDRKKDGSDEERGRSVYDIAVPEEMKLYLETRIPEFHTNNNMGSTFEEINAFNMDGLRLKDETERLSIPHNMYIWATMNSADQGVFPMDTAFKRRWDFKPVGINDGAEKVLDDGRKISEIVLNPVAKVGDKTFPAAWGPIVWDKLRRKINKLMKKCRVSEDKFVGPFFISPADLTDEVFVDVFKNKVLLYLYEDIGKMKRGQLFEDEDATYSELCEQFDKEGVGIFKDIDPVDVAPDEGAGKSRASSDGDLSGFDEAVEG